MAIFYNLRDLDPDLEPGQKLYRCATLIDLYPHTKFHQDRKEKLLTDGRTDGQTYGRTFGPALLSHLGRDDLTRDFTEHLTPCSLEKKDMGSVFSTLALRFRARSILALFVNFAQHAWWQPQEADVSNGMVQILTFDQLFLEKGETNNFGTIFEEKNIH